MDTFRVPSGEIDSRITRIQKELRACGMGGMLVVQRADLFYFSGTAQTGFLYIPDNGDPVLFIRRYLPRALEESSIKNIVGIESVRQIPERIRDFHGKLPRVLGFEWDVMPVTEFEFYRGLFTGCDYADASPLIQKVRMIKSDWEIRQIEKTAELSHQTFEYAKTAIRPGFAEMEFAGMMETFARRLGHGGKLRTRNYQAEAYPWHILSGENGGLPGMLDAPASGQGTSVAFPCGAGHRRFRHHEPIMIDLGFVYNGYHADETRMFAMGSMPEKAKKACDAAIIIHNRVLENVKPGMPVNALFDISVKTAEELGYAAQYLGPDGHKVNFIGHGIGVELIEPPFIAQNRTDRLQPGMVFALEPKMVFMNEFSAGIESVFRVTETGCALVSKVPVDVFVCPNF